MNNNNDNNGGGGLIILALTLVASFVVWLIRIFRKHRINKHTKKIVIMGGVGSGKTTLWKQLRGETLRYELLLSAKNGNRVKSVPRCP